MNSSQVEFSPSASYREALDRAADRWGIEREYWDIWGNHHTATPEMIAAVLNSIGVQAGSGAEIDDALERDFREYWSNPLDPVVVGDAAEVKALVRLPESAADRQLDVELRLEDGQIDRRQITATAIRTAILDGNRVVELSATLRDLPLGYHTLAIQSPVRAETRVIACPDRAFFPTRLADNGRAAGVGFSLYGVRSERNWGCGDFTDLEGVLDWVSSDNGASFVALNPLHSIPNRQPYNTSPYLPNCSFYKNPIYLDVERIPDFRKSKWAQKLLACHKVQQEIRSLRHAEYVEYERVYRLKLRILKAAFRCFHRGYKAGGQRASEFRAFIEREGDLLDRYAVYCALDEVLHKRDPNLWLWQDWPEEYRDPESDATKAFAREHERLVLFYKYIQWQIDGQLHAAQSHAKERGMAIGLYHDLALATDRFGADLWAYRPFYVGGCRVGAPPDDFAPNGQDWSFPPPNAAAHFRDGYRHFVEGIRKNLRHGGALRIDHVMRFFRLFWIPDTLEAKQGVYVKDRSEDLLRILALESVRNQVIIVGEDLGTVGDDVRAALQRFGILSYRLFYFEKRPDGRFKRSEEYPRQALVSSSTHDLPTLMGFWEARDIEARRAAGVLSEADAQSQQQSRQAEKQKMLDVLYEAGLLPPSYSRNAADLPQLTGELQNAIVGFLASTPSALMLLSEEDLVKQDEQQNLPGTTAEYPNWRHKTRFTVEQLLTSPKARDFAAMYHNWLDRTGRLNGR